MMTNYTSVPRYRNYFSQNPQRATYNTKKFWGRRYETKYFKDLRFAVSHSLSCNSWRNTSINFTFSGPCVVIYLLNPLTPNDTYSGRTAPLTSKRCILYIYSTNIGTEYFKHGIYSPFFPLQNSVCFIILTYLVPVLFTFYLQGVLKLKK